MVSLAYKQTNFKGTNLINPFNPSSGMNISLLFHSWIPQQLTKKCQVISVDTVYIQLLSDNIQNYLLTFAVRN